MKKAIFVSLALTAVCVLVFAQGCDSGGGTGSSNQTDSDTTAKKATEQDPHAALHQPKHGGVFAEFPGHKYAVEIIDDEATGMVTAFVTDAHFNPVTVDATEVKLNFVIGGAPKTYTLERTEQEAGKPATFTRKNAELAELICEGWQGDATTSVTIGGTPYNAKLHAGKHDHAH